jgi:hypothetical protein
MSFYDTGKTVSQNIPKYGTQLKCHNFSMLYYESVKFI